VDRFLIFALERSGSSSLAAALNRDLAVVQEPFSSLTGDIQHNALFHSLLEESGYLPENLPEDEGDEFAYNRFHHLARDPVVCSNYLEALYRRFTGIKHVRNTVSMDANFNILDWCLENDVKIIFLSRKKLGAALLSRFLAQQARVHNLGAEMENLERWQETAFEPIDIDLFQNQLDDFNRTEMEFRQHLEGKPCHYLYYEQLYQGWAWLRRRNFRALCRFLSTTPDELDPESIENYLFNPVRKQTNKRALARIPNFTQLKRYL
jgi:hypothetical protein